MNQWTKSVEGIVSEISSATGADWDEEQNLQNLAQFIEENCDQEKFREFIQNKAKEECDSEGILEEMLHGSEGRR